MRDKHAANAKGRRNTDASAGARGSADWSRRRFLKVGAGGAALAGTAAATASARANGRIDSAATPQLATPLVKRGVPQFDPDLLLLIDRITGGFSMAEYDHAVAVGGYEAYLDEQLNQYQSLVGPANDPDLWNRLTDYTIIDMTAEEIWLQYNVTGMLFIPVAQMTSIQIMFPVYARAQLYYRMMQFWNHHLNIDVNESTIQNWTLWPFLRDVVLANALGNVEDLIRDSAHGAAMLRYLNNYTNVAGNVDENYARELLELHTLGVDNGYDEMDVNEAARILTGWSACFSGNCSGGTIPYGEFWFRSNNHDTGDKTVMGQFFPGQSGAAGENEGQDLITFLTHHPNCADFISRKLCRFFLGGISYNYDPPEDVVQMAKWTYLNNPVAVGDIRSVLAVILHRDVLTQYAVPKLRRPLDQFTAALRAIGAEIDPAAVSQTNLLTNMRGDLNKTGMHPNYWGPPDGPYDSQAWAQSGMLPRWQFLDKLANNGAPEVADFFVGGVGGLLDSVGATAPGTQAQGLNVLLTGGRMDPKEVTAIQEFIGSGNPSEGALKDALAFAMHLPSFQFI